MTLSPLKILYAGDSPVGGAANYLLGILRFLRAEVLHLPPSAPLRTSHLARSFHAIILSDYSKDQVSKEAENRIVKQVQAGAGLWMIGGWGSFSGPFGKWRGSRIEKFLPVDCLAKDDRIHFPSGAWAILNRADSFLRPAWFRQPPVICGLNRLRPKKDSSTILEAREIAGSDKKIRLGPLRYPLLVTSKNTSYKSCAFASDLAPHWCGGLVDWGKKRLTLPVAEGIQIQVGDFYVRFVGSILNWLAASGNFK